MSAYSKPDFITSGDEFSLAYFSTSSNFLLVQGDLEVFFCDALNPNFECYNEVIEKLIIDHPEMIQCFVGYKEAGICPQKITNMASKQGLLTGQLSTAIQLSRSFVKVHFESVSLKQIFLAPYEHLIIERPDLKDFNILSFYQNKGHICMVSKSNEIAYALEFEYHKLQAQFANTLIEYYHNLESNPWLCSFHACAVQKNNKTYLILGDSGAGKSTLTALMCGSGYRFVGDDLILMDSEFNIYDNPAALSVKENSWNIVSKYHERFSTINESSRTKGKTKMKYLPLHLIQNNTPKKHKISALIWVNYKSNVKTQLKPLSSFDICSKLIPDTWVNPDSNYPELFAHWLIQTKGYQLTYSDFSSLESILNEDF